MPSSLPLVGDHGILPDTPAERDAAGLRKDFRSFDQDLRREADALRSRSCLPPDVPIPGTAGRAFKRRVRCSDSNEGKRGGYRFIYATWPPGLAFARLYHKRTIADLSLAEILRALVVVQRRLDAGPVTDGG